MGNLVTESLNWHILWHKLLIFLLHVFIISLHDQILWPHNLACCIALSSELKLIRALVSSGSWLVYCGRCNSSMCYKPCLWGESAFSITLWFEATEGENWKKTKSTIIREINYNPMRHCKCQNQIKNIKLFISSCWLCLL